MSFILEVFFTLFFGRCFFGVRFRHFSIEGDKLLNFLVFLLFLESELVAVKCECSVELHGVFGLFTCGAIGDIFDSEMFLFQGEVIKVGSISHLVLPAFLDESLGGDLVGLPEGLLGELLLNILIGKLCGFVVEGLVNTLLIYF